MNAVVLVGGEGTRLRPLTLTRPKQMLPIVEVPMLERVLAALAGNGVERAVLSLGYRPDAFVGAYPGGVAAGVELVYAVEPEPLDTAGAIRFAATAAAVTDTFVVVNGDVLTDLDVAQLIAFHRVSKAEATIALTPVDDPSRFGVVPTDAAGRVVAFVEKPPPGQAPTNQINAGTYVLEPSVLERIPDGRRVSVERETFPALAAEGRLFARSSDAYWLDTGTPGAYLQAHLDLLQGRRGTPPAPGALAEEGGWWRLGPVQVSGTVGPAAVVGRGATVEAGAEVREAVVGAEATVAAGARVERSVLLPGAVVEAGARVVDTVVGEQAVVRAGAVLEALTVIGDRAEVAPGLHLAGQRLPDTP